MQSNIEFDLSNPVGRQDFYMSARWRALRELKLTNTPLCENCEREGVLKPAVDVHHIRDIKECPTMDNALDMKGLMALCKRCHARITAGKPRKKKVVVEPPRKWKCSR